MKPSPFSAISRLMPLWRGSAFVSVFTSSARQLPYMLLVIHILRR
jgi:hypothetical protein